MTLVGVTAHGSQVPHRSARHGRRAGGCGGAVVGAVTADARLGRAALAMGRSVIQAPVVYSTRIFH
jgi:hypothetical protein